MNEGPKVLLEQEIEERILDFIGRELLGPGVTIGPQDDLLSGELLDSLAVLRLSSFVEEQFEIRIGPSDFVIENFQNVEVLTRFVQRATGTGPDATSHHRG